MREASRKGGGGYAGRHLPAPPRPRRNRITGPEDLTPIDKTILEFVRGAHRGQWWHKTGEPDDMGMDCLDVHVIVNRVASIFKLQNQRLKIIRSLWWLSKNRLIRGNEYGGRETMEAFCITRKGITLVWPGMMLRKMRFHRGQGWCQTEQSFLVPPDYSTGMTWTGWEPGKGGNA